MASVLAPLGRLRQWDDKNLEHKLAKPRVPVGVRRRQWYNRINDQGNTPMCVGFSGHGLLCDGPILNRPPFTPEVLYHWAQDEDEWPGNDYEGSSTLGVMKALKKRGYVGEYKWAMDAETVVAWVLAKGPALVGTNWHRDMFTPIHTAHGLYIEPTGSLEGGHEYRIAGVDLDRWTPDGSRGAVRIPNSWGEGWADGGRVWMSIVCLDKLIKAQGEAVVPLEIKIK